MRLHSVLFLFMICFFPIYQSVYSAASPKDLRNWILALKKNPNDNDALRNVGVYCFDNQKYDIAGKCWILVYKQNPSDPQALYFLGRLLELKKRMDLALKLFGKYGQVPNASIYRELMEGRYRLLSREKLKTDMRILLGQESQLSSEPPSEKTVAVFPFQYHGNNPNISPLGKGLAEMLMTDLSQIRNLEVVERLRIQSLLDEAKLGQTGLVKERSAPAFGKLLKAGKMVYGSFTLQKQNQLSMDISYLDAVQNVQSEPFKMNDAIKNLFILEKDIAFKVIDQMGIELTPKEKERIQRIPTKSMLAFVNYCMGLEMQDRGNFSKASEFYQKAVQLDPGYSMAKEKVNENRLLISAQSGVLPALRSESTEKESEERKIPQGIKPVIDKQVLINNRLKTVNSNIGSNFKPGVESRKSSQEAAVSGVSIGVTDLPKPPQPPVQ